MKTAISRITLSRFLILISIIAYFAFGDYSRYVYVIKVMAILGLFFSEKRVHLGFHLYWVVCFLICEALSFLWSDYLSNSLFYFVWTFQAMALAWVTGNTIHSKEDIEYVLKSIFIGGAILCIRVVMRTTLRALGSFRVGVNMGYNANELAMKCAVSFVAGCYFFIKKHSDLNKVLIAGLTLLILLIVVLTGSRQGALMAVMGMILMLTFRAKAPLKFFRNVMIALGSMVVFFIVVTRVEMFYNVLGRRLVQIVNLFTGESSVGGSISNRLRYAGIGLNLFAARPLIGYGTGSFAYVSGVGLYAHNNYVQLLVDLGLVGILTYYSIYAYGIRGIIGMIKRDKELSSIMLSFALMMIALEMTLVSFQNDYVQLLLALICACVRVDRDRPMLPESLI